MLRTPLPTSSQQQQTLLEQQQLQACTSAKGAEQQSRNQNALFAHNSAPSSSSTKLVNGKMSSIASLKQIVHPQYQAPSTVTHKSSTISNNNSQNNLDHKALLGLNFSQGSISINQNTQSQQLLHPGSHHSRSFSNQKITKSKGVKNSGIEQGLKPNLSSSELQLNGISFASNNLQNFALSSQGNSQHQQLELGHNSINSLSPPKFMPNQLFQSGEAPFNMLKQNYKKQKPAGSSAAIFACSATGMQQSQSGVNSTKSSLNMKRPKCLNPTGINNQSQTPKNHSSLSPDNMQLLANQNGEKQSQIEGINDNFSRTQAIQSTQSPLQSIAVPPPHAVSNIKAGSNIHSNKPTNSSCSEHKINVGSDRNGTVNANTLNNHILLSINQSQSIRRKMNNSSQSTANINSIINGNSSCIVYSKNPSSNYSAIPQESASLNATSFSPSPSSIFIGTQLNSLKHNPGQSNSLVGNGNTATNSKNNGNYKQDQQDNGGNNNMQNNSSTNIIFEKVKKRKMDNPSAAGGGHQQSSQQQLQYLIQNKSSQIRSPVANPTQMLSKKTSFSGHQNHFYSPNSYIKQPSAPSPASTLLQNQTVGAITSKLKAKNILTHQDSHSFGFSSNSQGTHALSTGTGAAHTNSNSKALISPPQTSDGVSSGNNTNHGRNGHSSNPKTNKENVFVHLPDQNYLSLNFSVGDQQFQHAASPSGQTSQDQTNPYNQRKIGYFSESLVDKHNPGEVIIVKRENQSPNGNLRIGNSPSQKGTCKLIMNKLSSFDLSASLNPMEHISEIVSLIHLSVVDTPLETVLGKFEENIQKINSEMRYREKQQMNKLAGKQKELEDLRRDAEALAIKLDQANFNKKNMFGNANPVDGYTQTSQKKRREQKNSKNAIIQICDQNGNVQEVDTDKENDMLRDYILDQEKKVNVFKEKEAKMIKLLLAVKKRGIDIDQIYNADVINDESADEIVKTAPQHVKLPFSGRQAKLDPDVFRKIDNDQAYADESIVNESDESSFGFIGKISDQDESAVIAQKPAKPIKGQKKLVPKQLQQKLKLNLDHLNDKNSNSDDGEEDTEDKENRLFHEHILATLQITQDQLDNLQDQIQKNPNSLSREQINLIQQIHILQQQHETDQQAKQKNQKGQQLSNQQQISGYQDEKDGVILNMDGNSSDNPMIFTDNFLPSELKEQLTAITPHSVDEDYDHENNDYNASNEFQGYQTTAFVPSPGNEFKQYFKSQ